MEFPLPRGAAGHGRFIETPDGAEFCEVGAKRRLELRRSEAGANLEGNEIPTSIEVDDLGRRGLRSTGERGEEEEEDRGEAVQKQRWGEAAPEPTFRGRGGAEAGCAEYSAPPPPAETTARAQPRPTNYKKVTAH